MNKAEVFHVLESVLAAREDAVLFLRNAEAMITGVRVNIDNSLSLADLMLLPDRLRVSMVDIKIVPAEVEYYDVGFEPAYIMIDLAVE